MNKTSQYKTNYFSTINSFQKAYYLGLIAADGCITHRGPNQKLMTIDLKESDAYILSHMSNDIGGNPVKYYPNSKSGYSQQYNVQDRARFQISNFQIVSDIESYGILPNKSENMGDIIQHLPIQYIHEFIVGYIDGNGSVSIVEGERIRKDRNNKKYPYRNISLQIRGTQDFLQSLVAYLKRFIDSDLQVKTYKYDPYPRFDTTNKKLIKTIFSWYQHIPHILHRKKNKLIKFFA